MDEVNIFIRSQDAKKTVDGNKYGVSIFKRFMGDDKREMESITPEEIDAILCQLFMNVNKMEKIMSRTFYRLYTEIFVDI